MEKEEFQNIRKRLLKSQKQMSELLGVSLKTIHSYEQGWRSVPAAVERQMYFLAVKQNTQKGKLKACWQVKKCSPEQKSQCPAWEFASGDLCWFINGTICDGTVHDSWKEKMKLCQTCNVFKDTLAKIENE